MWGCTRWHHWPESITPYKGTRMKNCVVVAILCAGTVASQAACPTWPAVNQPNARFTLNDTGTEVKDSRTGLIWKRCSEGQILSANTCTGSAANYTHEGALANARQQSGWRLPNVKELASLADKGCIGPAIDRSAFPNTPTSALYWTSSPAGGGYGAWGVDFNAGNVVYFGRSYDAVAVRLVRASQ